MPSGSRSPPQPGAQAAIHGALLSCAPRPSAPVRRSRFRRSSVQPCPVEPRVERLGRGHARRRDAEEDHVMDERRRVRVDSSRTSRTRRWRASGRAGSSGSRRSLRPSHARRIRASAAAGSSSRLALRADACRARRRRRRPQCRRRGRPCGPSERIVVALGRGQGAPLLSDEGRRRRPGWPRRHHAP